MKNPTLIHRILAFLLAHLLILSLSPPLLGSVTGRSADSSLAGTEKLLSDSSGTDTYILLSTLWGSAQALTAGITGTGSGNWDFSGSTGTFKTSTGINTFGGSAHNFSAVLQPTTNDAAALGTSSLGFSDLFLANGGVINWNAGEVTITQAAGVITVAGSGTGDLRITTAGTNAASVATVGGTQTLTNKTATALVLGGGFTASGSAANTLAGSTGTFITSTGANTFKGSVHNFDAVLQPTTDDAAALGTTSLGFSDLFLASGGTLHFANTDWVATHTTGILTVGTGDLRVTTAGTNTASVVTVGGTQTLAAKTFTTPVLGVATATSINKMAITAPATGSTLAVADGKTATISNTLTFAGTDSTTMTFPSASGTVITSSLSTNAVGAANSIWGASTGLTYEGATVDAFETLLASVDPTADQTASLPNFAVNYALLGSTLTTNTVDAANSIWGSSNTLNFEGATADTSEITLAPADATADVAYVLPNAAAATYSLMSSTLSTNAPDIANSVYGVSNGLMFEGATADAHEIRFTPADATADVVYLLPDAAAGSYAVFSSTLATNAAQAANSIWGASNALVFEGATADASETTIAPADATADTTVTIPAKTASGTMEVLSVEAEAATDTITAGQLYGSVITNTGAVGAAVYTLPAPVVGMHVRIYLTVAQDVDINPADGTQILALTNAAGDAISSAATIGNSIELIALSTTTWAAFATSGTWTDAN